MGLNFSKKVSYTFPCFDILLTPVKSSQITYFFFNYDREKTRKLEIDLARFIFYGVRKFGRT